MKNQANILPHSFFEFTIFQAFHGVMRCDSRNLFEVFSLSASLDDRSTISEHRVISGLPEDEDRSRVNDPDFVTEVATAYGGDTFEVLSWWDGAAFNDVGEVDGLGGNFRIYSRHSFNNIVEEDSDLCVIRFAGHDAIGLKFVGIAASTNDEELGIDGTIAAKHATPMVTERTLSAILDTFIELVFCGDGVVRSGLRRSRVKGCERGEEIGSRTCMGLSLTRARCDRLRGGGRRC